MKYSILLLGFVLLYSCAEEETKTEIKNSSDSDYKANSPCCRELVARGKLIYFANLETRTI